MTEAMWSEYETYRVNFGDPNANVRARINSLPASGNTVAAGTSAAAVSTMFDSLPYVILMPGAYNWTSRVYIPPGKMLLGAPGGTITINAQGIDLPVLPGNDCTVANIIVDGALEDCIRAFDRSTGKGASGILIYQFSARRAGYYDPSGTGSSGIRLGSGSNNNYVVSCEAFQTWDEANTGGNSDGVNHSDGSSDNTFIDVHSYNNGDDGFDMWQGNNSCWYFCDAHDNGKVMGKTGHGDGNGIKLGRNLVGGAQHRFYKTTARNNLTGGFNVNGNVDGSAQHNPVFPTLVLSTATGNPAGDYMNPPFTP